jgi:putative ABC transport system permease protein
MLSVFFIAWGNTFQNTKRTITALGGITFSILLVFLQLGFLNGAKTEVTLLFDYFDFDIAVTSDRYQFMADAPTFDRIRLTQVKIDEAVEEAFNLNVDVGRWVNPKTEIESTVLIVGLDDEEGFINNSDLKSGLTKILNGESVIIDRYSHKDYGSIKLGADGSVNKRNVNIVAKYNLGLFFFAEGSIATSNDNFVNFTGNTTNEVTLGLIKLKPGANVDETVKRIQAAVPDDVLVVSRKELFERERSYFIDVKPIGIMFKSAVFIAFAVGLVILFQVLSTELGNRLNEFATMKAMGFGPVFVYGIGITQNLIITLLSFLPALLLSIGIFELIFNLSKLPMAMTMELFLTVFALTMTMSIMAGLLALRKVGKADPAELF